MAVIDLYLSFSGNCEEAFNFYKAVFGGGFSALSRYSDMPGGENGTEDSNHAFAATDANKIMHIRLPIGQGATLMGSDRPAGAETAVVGDVFSISIAPASEEEALRIFNELSAGGEVTMPLEKTFWNALFGTLTDKFGIQWMVNYEYGQ
ncbi:MAG: VOC family protein [Chloroflexi bacterium]|nr:VOC family protein [Chloroflexota bacterium]